MLSSSLLVDDPEKINNTMWNAVGDKTMSMTKNIRAKFEMLVIAARVDFIKSGHQLKDSG